MSKRPVPMGMKICSKLQSLDHSCSSEVLVILPNETEILRKFSFFKLLPSDLNRALVLQDSAGYDVKQGRFAGAVSPEQAVNHVFFQLHIQIP
ncbi:hypothetical protein D3C77_363800 [compost metagenome]